MVDPLGKAASQNSTPMVKEWTGEVATEIHPDAKRAKPCGCEKPAPYLDVDFDVCIEVLRCMKCAREIR